MESDYSITFFDWGSSEPRGGATENCLALWHGHSFEWADLRCSNPCYNICEMEI